MQRSLLIAILVAALGWSGYWFWGARQTETSMTQWLEDRSAEGWVANYSNVSTRGFPNRFDTTITEPSLADPATGLAWRAPFLQFLSLSYRPYHLIAIWPETQTIATPVETVTVTAEGMRASLQVQPTRNMALDHVTMETGPTQIASTLGWNISTTHGQLAMRETPAQPLTYDFALTLDDVTPPASWTRRVKGTGLDATDLARANLTATIRFDAPWDLEAVEDARPQPQHIELEQARIRWGELTLQVSGALSVDNRGRADGELTVRATNWRAMLQVAQDSGLITREMARLAEGGLGLIARMSGDDKAIDAPLTFRKGVVTLGGVIPIGTAPTLRLR